MTRTDQFWTHLSTPKRTPGLVLDLFALGCWTTSHKKHTTIPSTEVSMAHKRGEEGKNCSQFFFTSKAAGASSVPDLDDEYRLENRL